MGTTARRQSARLGPHRRSANANTGTDASSAPHADARTNRRANARTNARADMGADARTNAGADLDADLYTNAGTDERANAADCDYGNSRAEKIAHAGMK